MWNLNIIKVVKEVKVGKEIRKKNKRYIILKIKRKCTK